MNHNDTFIYNKSIEHEMCRKSKPLRSSGGRAFDDVQLTPRRYLPKSCDPHATGALRFHRMNNDLRARPS